MLSFWTFSLYNFVFVLHPLGALYSYYLFSLKKRGEKLCSWVENLDFSYSSSDTIDGLWTNYLPCILKVLFIAHSSSGKTMFWHFL